MQNVWTSTVNPKRSNKNASFWPEAHNFRSTPNGMMRTIWFSNSNFRVFHVNGKNPRTPLPRTRLCRTARYLEWRVVSLRFSRIFSRQFAIEITRYFSRIPRLHDSLLTGTSKYLHETNCKMFACLTKWTSCIRTLRSYAEFQQRTYPFKRNLGSIRKDTYYSLF